MNAKRKIGEEIRGTGFTQGGLYVKQYVRRKYVVPFNGINNGVLTASLPGRLLQKCIAGEELLAQIIVDM